jgi:hypothetical protein
MANDPRWRLRVSTGRRSEGDGELSLIDVRCFSCGTVSEVLRPAAQWPDTPVCPACNGSTEQVHLPKSASTYSPAVVVYKAPDGTFRFPGETGGSSTGKYDRMGYERIEARGWAEVRSLEGKVNKQQSEEIHRRVERQQQAHEARQHHDRSDFYHAINNGYAVPDFQMINGELKQVGSHFVKMSPRARDLAMAAIAKNNAKAGPRFKDPGGFIEAFSMDRSNRDQYRKPDGSRGRD